MTFPRGRQLAFLGIVPVLALVLAGCGKSPLAPNPNAQMREVTVTKEAGEYVFNANNGIFSLNAHDGARIINNTGSDITINGKVWVDGKWYDQSTYIIAGKYWEMKDACYYPYIANMTIFGTSSGIGTHCALLANEW